MLALKIKNGPTPDSNQPVHQHAIPKREKTTLRKKFSSIGMAFPFHPSMWDEKTTDMILNDSLKNLEEKLKERYTMEVIKDLVGRLKKLYAKLNFNTHRKSLGIILTPESEKVFYLNFPVRPVAFFAKNISALELAANIKQETSFFYLVLDTNKSELYDFSGSKLRKVYEESDKPDLSELSQNIVKVIELLNSEPGKPVFVTGSPNLVELFCNINRSGRLYYPLLYDASPFSKTIVQSIVQEITSHWDYWRSKSIKGKILIARKANRLISGAESVLHALTKGIDGLLLLERRFKRQLQKPLSGDSIFGVKSELNIQIERFLMRGNQIEITETGLLQGFGGIVLLPQVKNSILERNQHKTMKREIF